MSGTGKVLEVYASNVRETNEPARTVVVDPKDGDGDASDWIVFEIPPDGQTPVVSQTLSWGPHYAWTDEWKIHKLDWERGFNDPLSPP